MSFNGKYIEAKSVIEKVFIDNGYTTEVNWSDAIEWMFEAFRLINSYPSFINKVYCIDIVDYKGDLPCDLHTVYGVRDWYSKTTYVASSDVYHNAYAIEDPLTNGTTATTEDDTIIGAVGTAIFNIDNNGFPILPDDADYLAHRSILVKTTPIINQSVRNVVLSYNLNNSFIFTSIREGKVEMAYKAFPIDSKGIPMIPDNQRFINAISSFIRYKIDYKLWRKGLIVDKILNDSEQEWSFYSQSSAVQMSLLSVDEMESIKNMWLRSIPRIDEHASSFQGLNIQEQRIIHSNR